MPSVAVLKFGSSVLRSAEDLPIAVDEIYRRWRGGQQVLAVVSAFDGVTDRLFREAASLFGEACPDATAAYVATGELKTAALLVGSLKGSGIPARLIEPREIGLMASGTSLESHPSHVDESTLELLLKVTPILVLPGFYGIDPCGLTALFGRGGSDMTALFLAAQINGECRLLKDVAGVFDADPARSATAQRFSALSWRRAIDLAGPLIQPKALAFANACALPFEVGRPNETACTSVGQPKDQWAATSTASSRPLRIILLGCGVVGRGVYEAIKRYPRQYDLRHVVVRDLARYRDIAGATTDMAVLDNESIDVVIECFDGAGLSLPLMEAALKSGKYVISANKAAVAERWSNLSAYASGEARQLWYSGAVAGAVPVMETLRELNGGVREVRGILNGTCGVVLEALATGLSLQQSVELAQGQGFAETDPSRDLSGRDAADKLSLIMAVAFGDWIAPASIPTHGIDSIRGAPSGYQLIARAARTKCGIVASVKPELPCPDSFLGAAHGAENRIEIDLSSGQSIRLRGQGAGRWPTTVSVMGDLHELARRVEMRV
jgi:homoserine dehydrogenase